MQGHRTLYTTSMAQKGGLWRKLMRRLGIEAAELWIYESVAWTQRRFFDGLRAPYRPK